MVGYVTYFLGLQVKQMKDGIFDSQSIYAGSSCTQLLWSNQKLKDMTHDVIKDGNEMSTGMFQTTCMTSW